MWSIACMAFHHRRGARKKPSAFGADYRTVRLPVMTLAQLCEALRPAQDIDFLKIDVEGAEADVCAGGDWQRFRPR